MGNNLVSWMSKKQNSISLSIAEAEYITAGSCCTQLLWMQKLLHDYDICQKHLTIYCDNTSAIKISKNPVLKPISIEDTPLLQHHNPIFDLQDTSNPNQITQHPQMGVETSNPNQATQYLQMAIDNLNPNQMAQHHKWGETFQTPRH